MQSSRRKKQGDSGAERGDDSFLLSRSVLEGQIGPSEEIVWRQLAKILGPTVVGEFVAGLFGDVPSRKSWRMRRRSAEQTLHQSEKTSAPQVGGVPDRLP